MKKWLFLLFFILLVIMVSVIPNIPLPFSFPVRVNNLFLSIYNRLATWLPFIFLFGIFLTVFITLFFRKHRNTSIKVLLLIFITIFICFLCSNYLSPTLRDYSKGVAISKTLPLINALEKYKKENNSYPESLNLLLPNYIDKIPSTKVLTIKNIEYRRSDDDYTLLFVHFINGWDADIVFYNSNNEYDDLNSELRKYGNWRYYNKN